MQSNIEEYFVDAYAYGKLEEFVHDVFVGLVPAREKLSENLQFIAMINPSDFRKESHRQLWEELQTRLLGKTRNIWLEQAPIERLTVRNKTLEFALEAIWRIHMDCHE